MVENQEGGGGFHFKQNDAMPLKSKHFAKKLNIFRYRYLSFPVCASNVSALANQLYLKNQANIMFILFEYS